MRIDLPIPEDFAAVLASMPPDEVLALRLSPKSQKQIDRLLEKNQAEGFSEDDQREWDRYMEVEHLVRMAKVQAALELKRV